MLGREVKQDILVRENGIGNGEGGRRGNTIFLVGEEDSCRK